MLERRNMRTATTKTVRTANMPTIPSPRRSARQAILCRQSGPLPSKFEIMTETDLTLCRSLLFLPASNPRAIAKARGLAADMVVLDLEDAVKAADKESARVAAVEAVAERFSGLSAIRINSDERWRDLDIAAVAGSAVDYVIVPMTSGPEEVRRAAEGTGKPVLAMVETAAGVLNAGAIAAEAKGLVAGTNDLSASLGIPLGSHRPALVTALQTIVLAARAGGMGALEGGYNRLGAGAGLGAEG